MPLVAVSTCPFVGAVAAETSTVVVADLSARVTGEATIVMTGVVVCVATVASVFAEETLVTVPVPPPPLPPPPCQR